MKNKSVMNSFCSNDGASFQLVTFRSIYLFNASSQRIIIGNYQMLTT